MALNRNQSKDGRVITNNNERVLMLCNNVELMFTDTYGLPKLFRKTWIGSVFLTENRVIFVTNGKGDLKSFMIQFQMMKDCVVKQPEFGSHYITGIVSAEVGGGWRGSTTFKLIFVSGGATEFGQYMCQVSAQDFRVQPETPSFQSTNFTTSVAYPRPPPPTRTFRGLPGPTFLYPVPLLAGSALFPSTAHPISPPPPYSETGTETPVALNRSRL